MKCPMKGMMAHGEHGGAAKVAAGAVAASTGKRVSKSLLGRLSRHPWALIGAGVVAGYMIHKYRKEIIGQACSMTDKSKDFVMQQKENLEDIVAESQQSDEDVATQDN